VRLQFVQHQVQEYHNAIQFHVLRILDVTITTVTLQVFNPYVPIHIVIPLILVVRIGTVMELIVNLMLIVGPITVT
jgi:hypothetical protein